MTVLVGVVGNGVAASEELIHEALLDAQKKAKKNKADMEFKVAVEPDPSESLPVVVQWLIDNEISYELIVHPDEADDLQSFADEAQKVVKSKTPTVTCVNKLVTEEADSLFVLLPDDADEITNDLKSAMAKAADNGMDVLNLSKGLADDAGMESISLDAAEGVDYDALGKAADKGDDDAMARLNELGAALDPEISEGDFDTWLKFAKAIEKATPEPEETEPEPPSITPELIDELLTAIIDGETVTVGGEEGVDPAEAMEEIGNMHDLAEVDFPEWEDFAAAIKEALAAEEDGEAAQSAADADVDAPSKWTATALKKLSVPELRTVVAKSGAGSEAAKWDRATCTAYLLDKPAEADEEVEAKPAKGGKAPSLSQRIEQARDQIASGVQALVNAILDGK